MAKTIRINQPSSLVYHFTFHLCDVTELRVIDKVSLAELTWMKMPPSGCVQTMEAICLIFARKPNVPNFKRLAEDLSELVSSLMRYDYEATSDYVRDALVKYVVNEPKFTPDIVSMQNKVCGTLCEWVRIVYDYAVWKSEGEKPSNRES